MKTERLRALKELAGFPPDTLCGLDTLIGMQERLSRVIEPWHPDIVAARAQIAAKIKELAEKI